MNPLKLAGHAADARGMGRRHALPILTIAATAITVFITVEPRQGRAVLVEQATEAETAPTPTLGTLEGRDFRVRIEATDAGPRYTVLGDDDRVIADGLTLDALAEQHPTLVPGAFHARDDANAVGPLMMVPDTLPD